MVRRAGSGSLLPPLRAGAGSTRAAGRRSLGVVAVLLAALLAGCQQGGEPVEPTSSSPSSSVATPGLGVRPSAEDFLVERTRVPVSKIASTIPLDGEVGAMALDPVAGEVYVSTCRNCHAEGGDPVESIQVIDMKTRAITDEIDLPSEMPGRSPRIAVDPYAGVLYVTRAGDAPYGTITVIDTASHKVSGAINAGSATLWGIAVDPTSGRIYVMQEAAKAGSNQIVVIDGDSRKVLDRIPVLADEVSELSVDPVHHRILVGDSGRGGLIVIDAAAREVERTVQVVPGMDNPCENCLGYLAQPVADPTSGLVYVSGLASVRQADASNALDQGSARVAPIGRPADPQGFVPVGGGASAVFVVDPEAGAVIHTIAAPGISVRTRACDPAAGVVYLSNVGEPVTGVVSVDTETRKLAAVAPIEGETTFALDPTSGAVWVAGAGAVTLLQ